MNEIFLTGLRARTPIGFLAALGTFRHADGMRAELGEVRLRWANRGSDWCAVLVTQNEIASEAFVRLLTARVCTLGPRAEFHWADQVKKNTACGFRKAVAQNAEAVDWFCAFATELARAKDGTVRSTFFDMTGGQQKFLLKLREGSAALVASPTMAEALLREAVLGPWRYQPSKKALEVENSHSLGLDPYTQLAGAFTADEPAGIKDKRGVRGAIWLAFESLPFFPCALSDGRLRTTGFFNQKVGGEWKTYFEWGVWEDPLTMDVCHILLAQPREEWTRERGIRERFRSERINLNKDYYSLAAAELVAL